MRGRYGFSVAVAVRELAALPLRGVQRVLKDFGVAGACGFVSNWAAVQVLAHMGVGEVTRSVIASVVVENLVFYGIFLSAQASAYRSELARRRVAWWQRVPLLAAFMLVNFLLACGLAELVDGPARPALIVMVPQWIGSYVGYGVATFVALLMAEVLYCAVFYMIGEPAMAWAERRGLYVWLRRLEKRLYSAKLPSQAVEASEVATMSE